MAALSVVGEGSHQDDANAMSYLPGGHLPMVPKDLAPFWVSMKQVVQPVMMMRVVVTNGEVLAFAVGGSG